MKYLLRLIFSAFLLLCASAAMAQHRAVLNCTSLRRAVLAMSESQSKNRTRPVHHRPCTMYYTALPKLWETDVIMVTDSAQSFFLQVRLSDDEAKNYDALEAQLEACLDAETLNWEADDDAPHSGFYNDRLHLYIRLILHPARYGGGMYLFITRKREP